MKIFGFWFCSCVSKCPSVPLRPRGFLEVVSGSCSGMRLGFSLCCHFVTVLLDAQICLADGLPASDKQSVRHREKCFHLDAAKNANKATTVCFNFKRPRHALRKISYFSNTGQSLVLSSPSLSRSKDFRQ